jgi:hypothetical protein
MRAFLRILSLTGITGALAALAAAAPAQAQTAPDAAAACTVEGIANTTPAVKVSGGSGQFKFDSGAGQGQGLALSCVVSTTPGNPTTGAGAAVATIVATSSGDYHNIVCGTGDASSTSNTVTSTAITQAVPDTATYKSAFDTWARAQGVNLDWVINPFVGTVGALVFGDSGSGTADENATGGGPIKITDPTPSVPTPPGDPNADCTSDFEVTGALAGVLPHDHTP